MGEMKLSLITLMLSLETHIKSHTIWIATERTKKSMKVVRIPAKIGWQRWAVEIPVQKHTIKPIPKLICERNKCMFNAQMFVNWLKSIKGTALLGMAAKRIDQATESTEKSMESFNNINDERGSIYANLSSIFACGVFKHLLCLAILTYKTYALTVSLQIC